MAEPPVKRYALVPKPAEDGIRRFQLARVSGDRRSPERLERMEEVAALDGTLTPPDCSSASFDNLEPAYLGVGFIQDAPPTG
jgi:hypothetical protein